MKRTITIAALLLMAMAACKKPHKPTNPPPGYITIDSANKMVSSYLASVNFPATDTAVRCFLYSAKELRYLLDSLPQSASIENIEIKMAHTLDYINNGHAGQFAGYNQAGITLLMVGVNAAGNYVYANSKVMNHGRPCPTNCPNGSAAAPLFVQ
ncbi:MAG TPA: hypothetical protein VL092_00575 [Chitinophagaceae bacterium]|nr:hypothetical protein [Chitinophagaceae bacterium]